MEEKYCIDRVRYESFGGILSSQNPPFLAWVDRDFMRRIGYPNSRLWKNKMDNGHLCAPTEAHFSVTNRCSQSCSGCYMDSNTRQSDLPFSRIKEILKQLRDMGVFHIALGGGEAFERGDFGEIVLYCRKIGLVPNLTTNGQRMGQREIEICRHMGQVNVSMDGTGEHYSVNGRKGSFEKADKTLRQLRESGIKAGINCTVSRKNFHLLESIVSYAEKARLNEIEFLKFKPSGRGRDRYKGYALDQHMIRSFYPDVVRLSKRYKVELKIDCSFIPAMVYHRPRKEDLEKLAVVGCDGGNLLLGIKSSGEFSACSFVDNHESVRDIKRLWDTSKHLNSFRQWIHHAPEPCAACHYLEICKGGCRAVALHLEGSFNAPDPECPFVSDYRKENGLGKRDD